jgi:pyruvate/2-oxoglutarate dehydrogenase complex dihydrolipoamide acyltransferase (E2) component
MMAKRGGLVTVQVLVAGVLVGGGSIAQATPTPHHDWSGVAQCLTGGNWQATGITYNANGPRGAGAGYGGLLISKESWLVHGSESGLLDGHRELTRADMAPQDLQELMADDILKEHGAGTGEFGPCEKYLDMPASSVPSTQVTPAPKATPATPAPKPTPAPKATPATPARKATPAAPAPTTALTAAQQAALEEAQATFHDSVQKAARVYEAEVAAALDLPTDQEDADD